MGQCTGSKGLKKSDRDDDQRDDRAVTTRVECPSSTPSLLDLYEDPNPQKTAAVPPPGSREKLPEDPLAGFEIELQEVTIIDFSRVKGVVSSNSPRCLAWRSLMSPGCAFAPQNLRGELDASELRERRYQALEIVTDATRPQVWHVDPHSFAWAKRSPLFSAPHGSWTATIDTVGKHLSRVEIVTCPFTLEEWSSEELKLDLVVLDKAIRALCSRQHDRQLVPLVAALEGVGVHIHEPEVFFCKDINPQQYFQMTRQLPIYRVLPGKYQALDVPAALARGMNVDAIRLLVWTIRLLENPSGVSNNPKENFTQLLKTPFHRLLVKPEEGDVEAWVQGIAGLAEITDVLRLDPVRKLQERAQGKLALKSSGVTWAEFLGALIVGKGDLLAVWSKTAFIEGDEDFGYGTVDGPVLDGWAIFEDRTLGESTNRPGFGSQGITNLLGQWSSMMKRDK